MKTRYFYLNLLGFCILKLVIHFATNQNYGFFRDEFYYLACANHLDWGYVDHPPLVTIIAAITGILFGDSLFAVRLPAALAGTGLVFVTGLMVKELGGSLFALSIASITLLINPTYLFTHTCYSMNGFDHLFWALSAYLVILILKYDKSFLWLILGFVLGIGLMNKISILFLGFGLCIGLILTPHRKLFLTWKPWTAAGVALILFSPYIFWQYFHDWATLEFMYNAQVYKNYPISPLQFVMGQIVEMHPFAFPIWLLGLYFFMLSRDGKAFRLIGWIFISVLAIFILSKAKTYYLAPAYPMLLAGGGVFLEKIIKGDSKKWLYPLLFILLIIGGLITAPMALPVLPVESYITYSKTIGLTPTQNERNEVGVLPQHFADMFGWEKMVQSISTVYDNMVEEEKANCKILVQNYGQAGALDYYRKEYNLPVAICPHNNYYFWSEPHLNGKIFISLMDRSVLEQIFEEVIHVVTIERPYSMPYENNKAIFICRNPKHSWTAIWPRLKSFM